jgi:hypothetical protein
LPCPAIAGRVGDIRDSVFAFRQCAKGRFCVRAAPTGSGSIQQISKHLLNREMTIFWRGHFDDFSMAQFEPTVRRIGELCEFGKRHQSSGCARHKELLP